MARRAPGSVVVTAIRNISDTALWAANYRAEEGERRDPLFRDPFAKRLAGERGRQIADAMPDKKKQTWAWVTRTYLFDSFIAQQIAQGTDMVLNLAAGLDARPYRMSLPPSLKWIEIDLPEVIDYKVSVLAEERPSCALERISLDLSNVEARRDLFKRIGREAKKALIITEGLLIYLARDEVVSLGRDLAAQRSFQRWILEIASPGLLQILLKNIGKQLEEASAPLKFGPEEGPEFFLQAGWKPLGVRSMLKTAAKIKRLPMPMRLLAWLPESQGRQGGRPWSGVCVMENASR